MLESKRHLKVFLCHASADKPAARKLYRYLRSKGMDPWLDVEKLIPGQRWEEEIPKALYSSDAIIVMISKNSITKEGYVQREIKFALDKALDMPEGRIFLIPARLEECELPVSLKGYQWVDLFQKNWSRRLMLSLNQRVEQLDLTPLPIPKKEAQVPPILTEDTSSVNISKPVTSRTSEESDEEEPIYPDTSQGTQKNDSVLEQPAASVEDRSQPETSDSGTLTPQSELTKTSSALESSVRHDVSPPEENNQHSSEQELPFEPLKEERDEREKIKNSSSVISSSLEDVEVGKKTPHTLPDLRKGKTKLPLRFIGILVALVTAVILFAWGAYSSYTNQLLEATAYALSTQQVATIQALITQTALAQSLTPTSTPTATQTLVPTFTIQPSVPTAMVAIIQAAEGGGAFLREEPGGLVLLTLANGTTIHLLPDEAKNFNGGVWVHVFTTINDRRVEGWMLQTIMHTVTPSMDQQP